MTPLDSHTLLPSGMREYISNYGFHFSKRAYEFAVSLMRNRNGEKLNPITKDQFTEFLRRFGIELKHNHAYDGLFVYSMAKADYYQSSIIDEQRLAMFIRDYIDDPDASEETTFRRWLATMVGNGVPIDWEDIV